MICVKVSEVCTVLLQINIMYSYLVCSNQACIFIEELRNYFKNFWTRNFSYAL